MSKTTHRKDITTEDFKLLAQFSAALHNVRTPWCDTVVCQLGVVLMLLPVWHRTGDGWVLAAYKEYEREAIGIAKPDMRIVCNYLNISQPTLLNMLYRLSMLGVVPGTSVFDKPRFRMPFTGRFEGTKPFVSSTSQGFIIEKRRSSGLFRG
jgi:hypothetical protein